MPNGDINLEIEIAESYQGRVLVETGLVAVMPLSAQITTGNVELFSPSSVVSLRCMAANVVLDGLGETHNGTSSFEIDTGNVEVRNVDNLLVYLEVETGRLEHSDDWKAVEPSVWKGAGLRGRFQRGSIPRKELNVKMKVGNIVLR
ncbi:MAG: hypothetical protein HY878_05360 [Deltaproteobacteria bacterium]|nr:hypothetical protein [Deltaproteobacteria bacterium]